MIVNHQSPNYIFGIGLDATVMVSSFDSCGSVAVLIRCKVNEAIFVILLVVPVFCVAISPLFFIDKYQMSKIYL